MEFEFVEVIVKALFFSRTIRTARFLTCLGAFALLLFTPFHASAQDTGLISGTVTDKSGAAVAGAQVVVTNTGGNLTRNTETNGDGVYAASALPAGTYDVTVTAKGFQKFQAKAVKLDVAQKARVDISLVVGSVSEEVVVTGESVTQVDTQSAEIGSTVTGKQVDKLILNGRNFTTLVNLVPGVVSQTGQDEAQVGIVGNTQYSINGGRTEYNNWEIDGGDNMDNGSNSSLNVYPNLEAIAEFKVLTSNYGAQYGKNGSGTVEVETKSGTSQFHGSAFYYGRNTALNANSWQNNGQGVSRPTYQKHDYGYTIGGPIFIPHHYNTDKKKTFFFWSQEWRKEKVPGDLGTISQNVPSLAERGLGTANPGVGDFNDVCPAYTGATFDPTAFPDCPSQQRQPGTPFAGNLVPLAPTAQALIPLIPRPNNTNGTYASGQAAGNPLPAYISSNSYPTTWREELIRVDQNLTDNERLTVRYIHDTWSQLYQGPLWGVYSNNFDNVNTNFVGPATSFVIRLASNFTPTLVNEFVASYTADHIQLAAVPDPNLLPGGISLPSGGIGFTGIFPSAFNAKNTLPAISVGNTAGSVYGSSGFATDTAYYPWKNANPTYTYRDNMTKILGLHTLTFGAYFVAAQKNQSSSVDLQGQLSFANSNPNTTGNPFADMLLGEISGYTQTNNQLYFYDRYKNFETYIQDDWRVTRKLTLNLGLRWSFFGRYQEKNNLEYGFSTANYAAGSAPQFFPFGGSNSDLVDPTTGNVFNGLIQCGASGVPKGCYKNKLVNPGPRIGFAWDPKGDGKTAIRGGYGIFFEHTNGNEANAESLQSSASPLVLNGTVPNISGYGNVPNGTDPTSPASPLSPNSLPNQVQWPYVQQWNLNVQHELPQHIVFSVAYVGSKGTHLTLQRDLNQLHPLPAAQNPYAAGQPITGSDCDPANFTYDSVSGLPVSATVNGNTVTGQTVQNLSVACGLGTADYYRPYQGLATITRLENTANSIYNALQVSAKRTVGDFTFSAAYTYSHSIDDSSDRYDALFVNSYDPNATRASSNFDVRHAFALSYVWAMPFFKGSGLAHAFLGGWQLSGITIAQTGLPFTVTNSTTYGDNAGVGNGVVSGTFGGSFPDLVGNPGAVTQAQKDAVAAAGTFGVLRYNPDAFALPTGLTFGNVGRNTLRLPGRLNFDFGLFKRFDFKERYAFEFRWETFNIFNHPQLDAVSGNTNATGTGATSSMGCVNPATNTGGGDACASSGFLVLNHSHNPRIMQFGLRFQF
jgi:hypothetical protein